MSTNWNGRPSMPEAGLPRGWRIRKSRTKAYPDAHHSYVPDVLVLQRRRWGIWRTEETIAYPRPKFMAPPQWFEQTSRQLTARARAVSAAEARHAAVPGASEKAGAGTPRPETPRSTT